MNLSEKLERAKISRLIAAGELSSEAALKPLPPDGPDGAPLFEAITIEAQPVPGLRLVADLRKPAADDAGAEVVGADVDEPPPPPCPTCQHPGRVDLIDLVGHTSHLSCDVCGTMWRTQHEPDRTWISVDGTF